MNTEEINEGGGWKPQSIDSNFELLNRIENLENKLNSPLYKSASAMLEALIGLLKYTMIRLSIKPDNPVLYQIFREEVSIIEQATGKTIDGVLCNHKR
jgi:hypothetical protein